MNTNFVDMPYRFREKISDMTVNKFLNADFSQDQVFDMVNTAFNFGTIRDMIDECKRKLCQFKPIYESTYGTVKSKIEFDKFVDGTIMKNPNAVKFKIDVDMFRMDFILEYISELFYMIDTELDKNGASVTKNMIALFNNIKGKLFNEINEGEVTNTVLDNMSLQSFIDKSLCPFYNVHSSNGYRLNATFNTTIYRLLFDSDVFINETFKINEVYMQNNQIQEYGPYGDLSHYLQIVISGKKASSELRSLYAKTVILLFMAVKRWTEYIDEIDKYFEEFVYYVHGDYEIPKDKQGFVDPSFYPESAKHLIPIYEVDHNFTSTEAAMISAEADNLIQPSDLTTTNSISLDKIDESYKNKFLRLQKTVTDIFKVGKNRLKAKFQARFFKKWFGRVPSMYKVYGSRAMITENRMKGDPTKILLSSGVRYLENMTKRTEDIFNDILDNCRKVTSAGDIHAKMSVVKNYCKKYKITDEDPKTVKMQIINEACYRIAHAILQNNGVYGYSAEGIVENKKFPTCNHIVVSLFIENAQEKAEEQSVADIFKEAGSLTVWAHPEKLNILETSYKKSSNSIMHSFNPKLVSTVHKNLNANYKLFTNNLTRKGAVAVGDNEVAENIADTKKLAKSIDDGFVEAIDLVIDMKKRCIQCVGAMYDMSSRIMNLAKRCIAALHEEELRHTDSKFDTGTTSGDLNRSTKSSSKRNMYNAGKTKADLQREMRERRAAIAQANRDRLGGYL